MDRLWPIIVKDIASMDHFGKSREKTFTQLDRFLTNFNGKSFKSELSIEFATPWVLFNSIF